MNRGSVDSYLSDGCGRCDHYRKPSCKVHLWTAPLSALRELLLASGLSETMKWGSPCYTWGGKNVVILASFRDRCALSFFKGSLLRDEAGVLESPGTNTRAVRELRFTGADEVRERGDQIRQFVEQAIALEESGSKVDSERTSEPTPEELRRILDADPALCAAFEALTPGRQRSHSLYVSAAKQSHTRAARAEKCCPKILAGKGYNER